MTAKARLIVQTLGGMGDPAVQTHATQLITRLARLTGAEPRLLTAQGVASSREAKLVMLADPYVRETMDLFPKLSLAILGIGGIEPSSMLARSGNVFSTREMQDVKDAGGVGEFSLCFFDAEGRPVLTTRDDGITTWRVLITAPEALHLPESVPVTFRLIDAQGRVVTRQSNVFLGPRR